MLAQGIRNGDRYDETNDQGRVIGGWTATGDAIIESGEVFVPVRYHDGGDGTRVWDVDHDVPLTLVHGVQFPPGTPEYDDYVARLNVELGKFARREPPYDVPMPDCPGAARGAGFGL